MANSIQEQLIASVKTTLEGIDGAGDYTETVTTVQRFENSADAQGDMNTEQYGRDYLPTIVIMPMPAVKIPGSANRTRKQLNVLFAVWFFHDKSADSRTTDEIINSWVKDLETALMADHTQGGLALSTEILMDHQLSDLEKFPDYVGAGVLAEFIFQHKRNDPTAA